MPVALSLPFFDHFQYKLGQSLKTELSVENFGLECNHVDLFYKSMWQKNEVSTLYLLYRWLLALFFLGVSVSCITLQFSEGKFFIYMTNWGYSLATVTMLISAVQTTLWHYDIQCVRTGVHDLEGQKARMTLGMKIYWWMYNVSLLLAPMISTVYWIFLTGLVNRPNNFPAISFITHALNTIFMLTDFMIVALPLRLLHVLHTILLAIVYVVFTLIYHVCGGTDEFGNPYVYPILDWHNPRACLITFGGVLFMIICYWLLLLGMHKLKQIFNRSFSTFWKPPCSEPQINLAQH